MSISDNGFTGETGSRDRSATDEQVQDLHYGLTCLLERTLSDERQGPDLQLEGYSFYITAEAIPPIIGEHFIDPPVEDMSVFGDPTYELYVGCPDDDNEASIADEAASKNIFWVSFVKVFTKPNGTDYRASIDYTLSSDGGHPPAITLWRVAEIEKNIPEWLNQAADQMYDNRLDGGVAADAENESIIDSLVSHDDVVDLSEALEELEYVEFMGQCIVAGLLVDNGVRGELPDTPAEIDGLGAQDDHGVGFREADAVNEIINGLSLRSQLKL